MTSEEADTLRAVIQEEGRRMREKLDELIAAVSAPREIERDMMDRPVRSRAVGGNRRG